MHIINTYTRFECHGALENGNFTRNNMNSCIQNYSLEILKERTINEPIWEENAAKERNMLTEKYFCIVRKNRHCNLVTK